MPPGVKRHAPNANKCGFHKVHVNLAKRGRSLERVPADENVF